jgi:acylphosphatase
VQGRLVVRRARDLGGGNKQLSRGVRVEDSPVKMLHEKHCGTLTFMALSSPPMPPEKGFPYRKWTGCGTLTRERSMDRRRMQLCYSGHVQGVGFRYTVKSVARGFEVTGTVRNRPDGAVELVAEGAKDELEAFRKAIRESGVDHFVRKEDVFWADATNEFRGFEIVR